MGSEAACTARHDGRVSRGTALLETDALIFRGSFRLAIPYGTMTRVEADGAVLTIAFAGGVARFELGSRAAAWAERIRNPKGLLDKLGVKSSTQVALVGIHDPSFVEPLRARTGRVMQGRLPRGMDIIFLAADTPTVLRRLGPLSRYLSPNGAIWVVARRGSSTVPEATILRAGKAARLVDVKVVRFSETHTAHKFVIPAAQRPPSRSRARVP